MRRVLAGIRRYWLLLVGILAPATLLFIVGESAYGWSQIMDGEGNFCQYQVQLVFQIESNNVPPNFWEQAGDPGPTPYTGEETTIKADSKFCTTCWGDALTSDCRRYVWGNTGAGANQDMAWFAERQTTHCTPPNSGVLCYTSY